MAPNRSIYETDEQHAAFLRANNNISKSVIDRFEATRNKLVDFLDRHPDCDPACNPDLDGNHIKVYLRARSNHPSNHRNPARPVYFDI